MARTYQVFLNIYDVQAEGNDGISNFITKMNKIGRDLGLGGVFHGAIQIENLEWSFGWCETGSGVYTIAARKNPMYQFRETVNLGPTLKSKAEIKAILQKLKAEWQGNTYELLSRNCCHFCEDFAVELGVQPVPAWLNRLASSADATVAFTNEAVAVAKHVTHSIKSTAANGFSWLKDSMGKVLSRHDTSTSSMDNLDTESSSNSQSSAHDRFSPRHKARFLSRFRSQNDISTRHTEHAHLTLPHDAPRSHDTDGSTGCFGIGGRTTRAPIAARSCSDIRRTMTSPRSASVDQHTDHALPGVAHLAPPPRLPMLNINTKQSAVMRSQPRSEVLSEHHGGVRCSTPDFSRPAVDMPETWSRKSSDLQGDLSSLEDAESSSSSDSELNVQRSGGVMVRSFSRQACLDLSTGLPRGYPATISTSHDSALLAHASGRPSSAQDFAMDSRSFARCLKSQSSHRLPSSNDSPEPLGMRSLTSSSSAQVSYVPSRLSDHAHMSVGTFDRASDPTGVTSTSTEVTPAVETFDLLNLGEDDCSLLKSELQAHTKHSSNSTQSPSSMPGTTSTNSAPQGLFHSKAVADMPTGTWSMKGGFVSQSSSASQPSGGPLSTAMSLGHDRSKVTATFFDLLGPEYRPAPQQQAPTSFAPLHQGAGM